MSSEMLLKIYEMLNTFLPIICVMGIFYVIVVMPQRKKMVQHQVFLDALKKGDKIVTNFGILGTIDRIIDQEVRVMIAEGVVVSMEKSQVARLQKPVAPKET